MYIIITVKYLQCEEYKYYVDFHILRATSYTAYYPWKKWTNVINVPSSHVYRNDLMSTVARLTMTLAKPLPSCNGGCLPPLTVFTDLL